MTVSCVCADSLTYWHNIMGCNNYYCQECRPFRGWAFTLKHRSINEHPNKHVPDLLNHSWLNCFAMYVYVSLVPMQTQSFCKEKGSGEYGHIPWAPGQGKEFECPNQIATLSKSCDLLLLEFGSTNHSTGLYLLSNYGIAHSPVPTNRNAGLLY